MEYKELITTDATDFESKWLYFSIGKEGAKNRQVFRVRFSEVDPIQLDTYGYPMGKRFVCWWSAWDAVKTGMLKFCDQGSIEA